MPHFLKQGTLIAKHGLRLMHQERASATLATGGPTRCLLIYFLPNLQPSGSRNPCPYLTNLLFCYQSRTTTKIDPP
jgi:hypothetical protein